MVDTLPDNANELVAVACEFTRRDREADVVYVSEFVDEDGINLPFAPATDPAAALKAADAYADLCKCDLELYREREKGGAILHWCKFENVMECRGPTRCFAVCRAIIEAEKVRTK